MPTHNFNALDGRVETIIIHSATLEGNLLGDPIDREVAVYLPPNYDTSTKEYPLLVDLVGYTDSMGSEAYNQKLSERRAQAVYQYLVSRGINGSIIDVMGRGELDPVASNETEEGRALNRRVDIHVGTVR